MNVCVVFSAAQAAVWLRAQFTAKDFVQAMWQLKTDNTGTNASLNRVLRLMKLQSEPCYKAVRAQLIKIRDSSDPVEARGTDYVISFHQADVQVCKVCTVQYKLGKDDMFWIQTMKKDEQPQAKSKCGFIRIATTLCVGALLAWLACDQVASVATL